MSRTLQCILLGVILGLPACASKETAAARPAVKTNPTLITVAKSGTIRVNHQAVPLKKLAVTLHGMGIAKNSQFKIEGETGTDQQRIEDVLDVLVINGYLPKDTID
ncbi:MAG TPA: hypothetical protein VG733_03070 [Chthoniobacteraceae bacterium]|nr:hypothetical protein [Chthoniobacteraceae bacterium]